MRCRYLSIQRLFAATMHMLAAFVAPAPAEAKPGPVRIQAEIWALPLPLPMFAYVVRPDGDGPFPLVIMIPLVEFRDAAKWFAQRGYLVVAPVGSGYGASAIDMSE